MLEARISEVTTPAGLPEQLISSLDARLASGDEWLDGKSVTAWFRAKQLLGL